MKIDIIGKETIKPSSPTPNHLKSFKLCLLDQLGAPAYFALILFYPENHVTIEERRHKLKKSLLEALTQFYPFFGRIENNTTIECDDNGDMVVLQRFLPIEIESFRAVTIPLLLVQLNFFDCGGLATGLCMSHRLADASTLCAFIKHLASISTGHALIQLPCLHYDQPSSFFPARSLGLCLPPIGYERLVIVTKSYVFNASKIATPKAEAVNPLDAKGWIRASGTTLVAEESETELKDLVAQLRKGIIEFDEKLAKKLGRDDSLELIEEYREERVNKEHLYSCTNWLIDTKESDVVEAWVTLIEEDMALFECDPQLLSFAMPNPSRRRNFFGRGGGRSKPTCQLCGVYGHVVAQCYRRFDSTFLGPNVGNTVSEVLHPPTPSNFIGQSFASHPLYSLSAPNFPSKYLDNQATLTSAFSSPSSFIRSQTGTPYYASQTPFPLLASHYPLHSRPTPPLLQFGTLLQVATTTSSYAPSVGPPSRPVSSSLLAQSHMVHSTTTTTAPQNSFPVVVVSDKFAGHYSSFQTTIASFIFPINDTKMLSNLAANCNIESSLILSLNKDLSCNVPVSKST
ncbi:hypothetical protein FEM48_Zijuj10G0042100 [Ziziphus jujuba var. spinosa]|uniref:Transferase n=1 Tax=Ziziphus jujuba var. spinosa TaxID=714518 RepID=A0A978UL82_ZIZJJ|nr:hypothetical protein FEM48_Zijuj10G0042100 [Ziziphus jujuba var. spinosa]